MNAVGTRAGEIAAVWEGLVISRLSHQPVSQTFPKTLQQSRCGRKWRKTEESLSGTQNNHHALGIQRKKNPLPNCTKSGANHHVETTCETDNLLTKQIAKIGLPSKGLEGSEHNTRAGC